MCFFNMFSPALSSPHLAMNKNVKQHILKPHLYLVLTKNAARDHATYSTQWESLCEFSSRLTQSLHRSCIQIDSSSSYEINTEKKTSLR